MSGEAGMGREKRGKQTLRKKMMVVMLISAMSSILAVVIVSYMTIRMIRNDSIQESMQIYLEQITRETDSAYYDMISIVNQMSPSGLIGNVVESYLSAEDNFDKYTGQKSLREELVKLGYVNTKLLGVTYYDLEEQSELIRNINVRNLDQVYQTIPNVTENIGNTIQAMHLSLPGNQGKTGDTVKQEGSSCNRQKLEYLCRDRAGYECCGKAKTKKTGNILIWNWMRMVLCSTVITLRLSGGSTAPVQIAGKRRVCGDKPGRI